MVEGRREHERPRALDVLFVETARLRHSGTPASSGATSRTPPPGVQRPVQVPRDYALSIDAGGERTRHAKRTYKCTCVRSRREWQDVVIVIIDHSSAKRAGRSPRLHPAVSLSVPAHAQAHPRVRALCVPAHVLVRDGPRRRRLALTPGRGGLASEVAEDVRQRLGGARKGLWQQFWEEASKAVTDTVRMGEHRLV